MALSDLRSRRIGMIHLVIFGITLLTASLIGYGWRTVIINAAVNILTCLLLWGFLLTYSVLRKKRPAEMIGSGDLLFALTVTPYFGMKEYVLYLIASCVLTLAVWLASGIRGQRCRDIPLVTGAGTCLLTVILYRTITIMIQ